MFKIIIIFITIYVFLYIKRNKIKIKYKTLFKKGMLVETGPYGVYCYVGKQGSGKTYSVIEYLHENSNKKIYSNVKSIKDLQYTYIANFNELLQIENDTDDNIIIFYDEIFSALTKQDKMSKEVLSFLSQMRKRKIIFLTTAQEWLEINVTLRRYVRFQIDCSIFNVPFIKKSFLLKVFHDGDLIHWDNLSNDYISPIIETTLSKMNIETATSYDTYEVINSSNSFKAVKDKSFTTLKSNSPGGEIGGVDHSHTTTKRMSGSWSKIKKIDHTFWLDLGDDDIEE